MRRIALALGSALAAVSILSACGPGTPSTTVPPTATVAPATTVTPAAGTPTPIGTPGATATPGPTATPAGPASLSTATKPLGRYLTDGSGRSLYLVTRDARFVGGTPTAGQGGSGTSSCTGPCAAVWPPLLTTGNPTAGDGVNATLIGTVTRADGGTQVTYNGWPLHYSYADTKPGDINGETQGGVWFLVSPEGNPVRPLPAGTPGAGSPVAATSTAVPATPAAQTATPTASMP